MTKIITSQDITFLIQKTISEGKGWSRICLHEHPSDLMHSMVMCMLGRTESGFHRHKKSRSIITYTFLMNSLDIEVVSELNVENDIFTLSDEVKILSLKDCSSRNVINRGKEPVVYLEHRSGPYLKEDIYWENHHK